MNEPPKKIQVNSSSLVELKAELIRKQQEFHKEKLQSHAGTPRQLIKKDPRKSNIWSKKNAGVQERAQKDVEEKQESENLLEKSRSRLEAKAKLYEQMSKGAPGADDDDEQPYLVDFEKKIIDSTLEQRKQHLTSKKEDQQFEDVAEDAGAAGSDEEWVDYEDAFGRSRRCMKRDLPELQRQDRLHARNEKSSAPTSSTSTPDLLSDDMRSDLQRQKWEEEEREALEKPTGPVHYADVQHKEIRTHGVGYYQFSKEEEERKQQFEVLNSLRQQTKDTRDRKDRLKEKRQAIMEARLAKIRQKRGLPEPEKKEEDDILIGPKLKENREEAPSEPLKRDDTWRTSAPITREWDKGKKVVQDYYQERREERPAEFAPPQIYTVPSTSRRLAQNDSKCKKGLKDLQNIFELKKDALQPNNEADFSSSVEEGLKAIRAEVDSHSKPGMTDIPGHDKDYIRALRDGTVRDSYNECPSYSQGYQDRINIPFWSGAQPLVQPDNLPHSDSQASMKGIDFSLPPPPPPPPTDIGSSQTLLKSPSEEQMGSSVWHNGSAHGLTFSTPTVLGQEDCDYVPSYSITEQPLVSGGQPGGATELAGVMEGSGAPGPKRAAPQPAHYSSAPCAVQPKAARYERVHLHTLPPTLPAPPTSNNIPVYRSQEAVHAARHQGAVGTKPGGTVGQWYRQFNYNDKKSPAAGSSAISSNPLKPASLPFQSSFIQKKADVQQPFADVEFDPSKPPPTIPDKKN